jgi:hypothetical protein
MFASSLLSGENCNNLDIRVSTVRGYVQAAQDLMVMGGYAHPEGLPMNKEHSGDYKKFVARAKKLESMPQRREMISDEMLDIFLARKQAAKTDSLDDCFFDWLCMGRYTGFRSAEWAQTRKTTFERISRDNNAARAMIDEDFVFFDDQGRLLEKTAANAKRVRRVDVCWRVQKNGQNGEIISYWRDDEDPRWCPVRAAWRICMRHRQRKLPSWMPLGIYIDHKQNRVFYMNVPEVERLLRTAAKEATGITDDKLINKLFGMHTIRVTACNELARLGVKDSFIQKRLRWRSLTFLDYLRNNIYNAHRHNLSRNIRISPKDGELHTNLISHTNNGAINCF